MPLVSLSIAWLAGIALASRLRPPATLLALLALLPLAVFFLWRDDRRVRLAAACGLFLLLGAGRFLLSVPHFDAGDLSTYNDQAWVTLQGTVVSVDADALVVETTAGEQVTVESRPWWFAQDQGFSTEVGNQVSVTGFYENGDFEAGEIVDLTAGQSVLIRDESGRPLWAGGGRRGA